MLICFIQSDLYMFMKTLPPCAMGFHLISLWFPSTCLYTKRRQQFLNMIVLRSRACHVISVSMQLACVAFLLYC